MDSIIIPIVLIAILFCSLGWRLYWAYAQNKRIRREEPQSGDCMYFEIVEGTIGLGDIDRIIEPLTLRVDTYGGLTRYEEDLTRFTPEQRLIFVLNEYAKAASKRGHYSYFYEGTGLMWPEVRKGLQLLQADDAAALFEEALQRMGGEPSQDRYERQDYLDAEKPDFTDLDVRYRDLHEPLREKMMDYIRVNKEAFYFYGEIIVR